MTDLAWENLVQKRCGGCGIVWAVPLWFDRARKQDGKEFYCPNGCCRVYREPEAERLRREVDQLRQREAFYQDQLCQEREIRAFSERRARAFKGHLTRTRRRVAAGACPCCGHHFADLEEHMQNQHPGFGGAEGAGAEEEGV